MKNNRTTKGVVMRTPIEVQASTELGNRRVDSHLGTRAVVNAETEDLIRASVSKQTLTNYKRLIKQVETWLGDRVLDDALLADYISMLHHDEGKAPATISQVVASVSWRSKQAGQQIVGEITLATMAGIRREGAGRGTGQVDGLTWEQVDIVVSLCLNERTIRGLRDASLIRLMSDCLLRVGEAVAVNCSDVRQRTLRIRKSKTDQEGKGVSLYVCEDTREILSRYREAGKIERGALFRWIRAGDHVTSGRLTTRSAQRIIKGRAKRAGYDGFISSHSLRVGSAVSLAREGASLVAMQNAGRWKDPSMPAHYAEAEFAERGAVAKYRENGKI